MIRSFNFIRRTEGGAAIIIAITLFVLIGAASLAIDIGQLSTVRNELQNVADAAALAGVAQLIQDQGGTVVRDCDKALQAAMQVAQTQSQLSGLPQVDDSARNDLTIHFGVWDIYAADRSQAWTDLGTTCASDSNANAMMVTIRRASGNVFGPVANFFAQVLGYSTSEIGGTATAYLGYTTAAETGTVTVPLALPQSVLSAMLPKHDSWFARLFAPREAFASAKTLTFKDLGGQGWYNNDMNKPLFDTTQAFLFIVNSNDSVPGTVVSNLQQYYTSGGTAIRSMKRGDRVYALSEYQWASNIKTIFSAFKSAYNNKKNAQGKWRVNVALYSRTNPLAQQKSSFPWYLVKRLLPGVTEAYACHTYWTDNYTGGGGKIPIYVDGFANVDITNVTYKSDCLTVGMPYQVTNPDSCRNTCSVDVSVPTDQSTLSPPGSVSGGPDNQHITTGAPANVGAFASEPKLVK
jgi:Flp pilus assembly protein TadG